MEHMTAIVAFECCTAHEVVESLYCLERPQPGVNDRSMSIDEELDRRNQSIDEF